MRTISLVENDPARPFELTADEALALDRAELAVVTRRPGGSTWDVAAGAKVGVVRVGELQVSVRPKVTIDRLLFLMSYAFNPGFWREEQLIEVAEDLDLFQGLAVAFATSAALATRQGLLQGYRTTDDSLAVVRGRVRLGDQIARRPGRLLPVEVTYDDFTANVLENRILLTACSKLLKSPLRNSCRPALLRLRVLLGDVEALTPGEPMPGWRPTRLNVRYHHALQLATLILSGDSFEQRVGELKVAGYVLDMARVFEDFVCAALREALRKLGGTTRFQSSLALDEAGTLNVKPDLLWGSTAAGTDGVVDAKYKAHNPVSDVYQLIAYCSILGLDEGHLVYAAGDSSVHTIVRSGLRIHSHVLNLEASPADLLKQVQSLATLLVRRQGLIEGRVATEDLLVRPL